jgi:hypothetical protein
VPAGQVQSSPVEIPGLGGGGVQFSMGLGTLLVPAGLASLLAAFKRRKKEPDDAT